MPIAVVEAQTPVPIVNGHGVCCSWATLSGRVQVSAPTVVDHRDPQLLGMSNQISLISPISLIWPDVGGYQFQTPPTVVDRRDPQLLGVYEIYTLNMRRTNLV